MKSMLVSDEEKKDQSVMSVVDDKPKYPYGLKVHFDEKAYKKLQLSEQPKIGQKMMMLAYVEVCDIHQNTYRGDVPELSMSVQIMDVELKSKEEKPRDVATEIYG